MNLGEHFTRSSAVHAEAQHLKSIVARLSPEEKAELGPELALFESACNLLDAVDREVTPVLIGAAVKEILAHGDR